MMRTRGYGAWERQEYVETVPAEPAELAEYIRHLERADDDGIQRGVIAWPLAVATLLVVVCKPLIEAGLGRLFALPGPFNLP